MKILSVTINNINSLKGEHTINFYPLETLDDSLCLIFGPTGSGKTTIYDAVSLTLFGRTPRYSSLGSERKTSPVVTTNCREASAKVLFEVADASVETGKQMYRAEWEQRYANARAKDENGEPLLGDLNTTRALYRLDGDSWTCIASGENDVSTRIVSILKLTYDQFQRIVMLAQGEFTRFLKGNDNDRGEILEKLSDTGIYRKLSQLVHETFETMSERVQSQRDAITDNESEIKKRAKDGKCSEDDVAREQELLKCETVWKGKQTEALEWEDVKKWLEGMADITQKQQALQAATEAFAEDAKNLEQAICARQVKQADAYQTYTKERADLTEKQGKVEQLAQETAQNKTAQDDASQAVENGEKTKAEADKALAASNILVEQVKAKDKEIEAAQAEVSTAQTTWKNAQKGISDGEKAQQTLKGEIEALETSIKAYQAWRELHKNYEQLGSVITSYGHYRTNYASAQAELQTATDELKKIKNKLVDARKTATSAVEAHQTAEADLKNKTADKQSCQTAYDKATQGVDVTVLRGKKEAAEQHGRDLTACQNALTDYQKSISDKKAGDGNLKAKQAEQDKLKKKHEDAVTAVSEADKKLTAAQEKLNNLQYGYNLAQQEMQDILKELRAHLQPGEPCPVCGAREHTVEACLDYQDAAKRFPEQQAAVEGLIAEKKKLEKEEKQALKDMAKVSGEIDQLIKDCADKQQRVVSTGNSFKEAAQKAGMPEAVTMETLSEAIRNNAEEVKKLNEQLTQIDGLKAKLDEAVQAETTAVSTEAARHLAAQSATRDVQDLEGKQKNGEEAEAKATQKVEDGCRQLRELTSGYLPEADSTQDNWVQTCETKLGGLKKEWDDKANDNSTAEASRTEKQGQLKAKQENQPKLVDAEKAAKEQLDARKATLTTKQQERKNILGEVAEPVAAQQAADKTAREAAAELERLRMALVEAQAAYTAAVTRETTNNAAIETLTANLAKSANEVASLWTNAGFETETAMLAAALTDDRYTILTERANSLESQTYKLAGEESQLQTQKSQLKQSFKDDDDIKVIEARVKALTEEAVEKHQEYVDLNGTDSRIRELRGEIADLQAQIEAATPDLNAWEDLDKLIGSASGDKLAKIAQSVTLDQLMETTNGFLQTIMPRYSLCRQLATDFDRNKKAEERIELGINVIDHYHGDAMRDAKGTSGGEQFIISLALALGLSDLNNGKLDIQSLFLDEGFGTLDEDVLHQVIGLLQNLRTTNRQHNRKIFIISHVRELLSAIPEQIRLTVNANHESHVSAGYAASSAEG